jgi:hypothetical protein
MANNVERFQSFCRQYVNRKVREHFKDLGGDDWRPDFTNDRHVTRAICTHDDDDPLSLTVGRLLIYNLEVKDDDNQTPLYSIPSSLLYDSVECVPQVIFNFQESVKDARTNKRPYDPLTAQHYIRFKGQYDSETEVLNLANKIKRIFATPRFYFDKGKVKYTYFNKRKNHDFRIFGQSEDEARKVVDKLLTVTDEEPDWGYLSESRRRHKNFNAVEYIRVNGKRRKKPQRRQFGRVYFRSAELHVDGMQSNIHLIDLSGRSKNPIVKL